MSRTLRLAGALLVLLGSAALAAAQENGFRAAPVVVDGNVLLQVRGIASMPAESRARDIVQRFKALAEDPAIDPTDVTYAQTPEGGIELRFGGRYMVTLYAVDAALEDVPLDVLAGATARRMREVMLSYREARTTRSLLRSTGLLVLLTVLAGLLVWLVLTLLGSVIRLVERHLKGQFERLEQASH